jgi:hypothetical protein
MKFMSACFSIALLLFATLISLPAQAASGLPDTLQFGYGSRLDINGEHVQPAMNAAAGMGMDWVAIDFDWAEIWYDPGIPPDLNALHHAMALAKNGGLNVMMSIVNAPAWASGPSGPDPELTAGVVVSLANLYPGVLLAVELFPGANTAAGWGAAPDPAAYAHLLSRSAQALKQYESNIVLVAGGLVPLPAASNDKGMGDLEYLNALYKAGAGPWMPIISLRLDEVSGDPMYVPGNGEPRYLRHFEEVRRVMLQNGHQNGILWISSFSWPDGSIQSSDMAYLQPEAQVNWLNGAYRLIRAQLYIGAAFFAHLNPPVNTTVPISLVLSDANLHPAAVEMGKMVVMNGSVKTIVFKGNISKKTPLKLNLKP